MAPLALVAILTTRWRHLLKLQVWPPDGATCISCKFAYKMAPLVLLSKLTTRLHYLYCYIALLALSVSIELVSSSARVTSVKSAQRSCTHSVRDTRTRRSDPRYTWVRYLCNHFWLGVSVNIVIIWPDPTPMGYYNHLNIAFWKVMRKFISNLPSVMILYLST